jgi:hypothetical protein
MARRVRRLAVVVLLLLIAGAVALVLTTRPQLEDHRDDVDRAWTPLRAPIALPARYERLAAVHAEMTTAGAGDRAVTRELGTSLARWDRLRRAPDGDADADAEATTADELEGLATRLNAVVLSSDRLKGVESLNRTIAEFQGTAPPLLPAVKTYNAAVQEYEDTRNGLLRRPAVDLFGYESRPQLLLTG